MLARVLLSLSLSACARWEAGGPECKPDRAPLARKAFTATAVSAAPTTTGFVLRLGGFEQRIRIGTVESAATQGWHWALVRTDAFLQTLDSLELDDKGTTGEGLIVTAGDAVFSETRNNFNFDASVSRIGAAWATEWTFSTRVLLDSFSRSLAASSTTVGHVYTASGPNAGLHLVLLDAASGALLWDAPIRSDFTDVDLDLDGNAIVVGRSAASRVARSDGSLTQLLTFTGARNRVEATPTGFLMLGHDPGPTVFSYDAAWSERWRVALDESSPVRMQLRALANGDALVLNPDGIEATLTRIDSGGAVTSTQHVCATSLLAVDAMDRALLVGTNYDELLLQPTF